MESVWTFNENTQLRGTVFEIQRHWCQLMEGLAEWNPSSFQAEGDEDIRFILIGFGNVTHEQRTSMTMCFQMMEKLARLSRGAEKIDPAYQVRSQLKDASLEGNAAVAMVKVLDPVIDKEDWEMFCQAFRTLRFGEYKDIRLQRDTGKCHLPIFDDQVQSRLPAAAPARMREDGIVVDKLQSSVTQVADTLIEKIAASVTGLGGLDKVKSWHSCLDAVVPNDELVCYSDTEEKKNECHEDRVTMICDALDNKMKSKGCTENPNKEVCNNYKEVRDAFKNYFTGQDVTGEKDTLQRPICDP